METISLNLSSTLSRTVAEMAASRSLSTEAFLTQTVDALAADYRLHHHYKATPLIQPLSSGAPADPNLPTAHTNKLSGPQIQMMLHLSQTVTPGQLSRRFGISETGVRRVLETYTNGSRGNLLTGSKLHRRNPAQRPFTLHSEKKAQP